MESHPSKPFNDTLAPLTVCTYLDSGTAGTPPVFRSKQRPQRTGMVQHDGKVWFNSSVLSRPWVSRLCYLAAMASRSLVPLFRMRISPGLQYRHEFIHYSRTWGGAYSEPCVEQKSGRVFRKETKGLCPGARHAARRWRQRRAEAPCIPVAALQARAATTVVIPACGAAVPHCAWGFARVLIGH